MFEMKVFMEKLSRCFRASYRNILQISISFTYSLAEQKVCCAPEPLYSGPATQRTSDMSWTLPVGDPQPTSSGITHSPFVATFLLSAPQLASVLLLKNNHPLRQSTLYKQQSDILKHYTAIRHCSCKHNLSHTAMWCICHRVPLAFSVTFMRVRQRTENW